MEEIWEGGDRVIVEVGISGRKLPCSNAETQWGKKRAEKLLNKSRKELDEVEWDIAVLIRHR